MCQISILFDIYWRQLEKKVAPIISLHSPESFCYSDFPRYRMLDLSLDFSSLSRSSEDTSTCSSPALHHQQGQLGLCGGSSVTKEAKPAQESPKMQLLLQNSITWTETPDRRRDKIKLGRGFCGISKLTPKSPVLLFQSHCQGTL